MSRYALTARPDAARSNTLDQPASAKTPASTSRAAVPPQRSAALIGVSRLLVAARHGEVPARSPVAAAISCMRARATRERMVPSATPQARAASS